MKECRHKWLIESTTAQVARGTCPKCAAEREFDNWGTLLDGHRTFVLGPPTPKSDDPLNWERVAESFARDL